jgi:hypothetical protein
VSRAFAPPSIECRATLAGVTQCRFSCRGTGPTSCKSLFCQWSPLEKCKWNNRRRRRAVGDRGRGCGAASVPGRPAIRRTQCRIS